MRQMSTRTFWRTIALVVVSVASTQLAVQALAHHEDADCGGVTVLAPESTASSSSEQAALPQGLRPRDFDGLTLGLPAGWGSAVLADGEVAVLGLCPTRVEAERYGTLLATPGALAVLADPGEPMGSRTRGIVYSYDTEGSLNEDDLLASLRESVSTADLQGLRSDPEYAAFSHPEAPAAIVTSRFTDESVMRDYFVSFPRHLVLLEAPARDAETSPELVESIAATLSST